MVAAFPKSMIDGVVAIDKNSRTPLSAIPQVLYMNLNLSSLTTDMHQATYDWVVEAPADPNDWKRLYTRFDTPLHAGNSPPVLPPPPRGGIWNGNAMTGLDIDLTAPGYGLQMGKPVAIAINLAPLASGDVNYSFLKDQLPFLALTVGKTTDQSDLGWIEDDDFSQGLANNVLKTIVFVCNLRGGGVEKYTPFNLAIVLTSASQPTWSLPLFLDPEIKNDG